MELIKNFGLWFFSIAAVLALFIPHLFHQIANLRYGNTYRRINYYLLSSALAIDIMGNTLYKSMLNDWFIKKGGYHYGKKGETISSATGKNQIIRKQTAAGIGLAGVLDLIDKDHSYKAIDDKEFYLYPKPKKIKLGTKIIYLILFLIILFLSLKLFFLIF